MRILVFGAGAVGSVVGAKLASAHEVALVGRASHVAAIAERGLRITGRTELVETRLVAVTDVGELEGTPPEVVLVTVKAYATDAAMAALEPYRQTSIFVSLQNGLGNEEVMAGHGARVLGAVINQGATFLGPGEILHAGAGATEVGVFAETIPKDAEVVAEALDGAGIEARTVPDIRQKIWDKVILNAAVNPVTALLGLRTGELLDNDALERLMRQVVEESATIAAACGVSIDAGGVLDTIRRVAEATRDNKSSMLQDLEGGRRTEIDSINGALVERARKHGLDCPANELLADLVRAAGSLGDRG